MMPVQSRVKRDGVGVAPAYRDRNKRAALLNDPRNGMSHEERLLRAEWKWKEAAFLLLRHGYSSERVLREALRLSPSRVKADVSKWVKQGWMRKVALPVRRERLIMLTREGATHAQGLLGLEVKYKTDSSTIAHTLVAHNLAVQMAAIVYDQLHDNKGLHRYELYLPEAICQGNGEEVRVDALIRHGEKSVILEIELSAKSPQRLSQKMEALAGVIEKHEASSVLWITYGGRLANALKRARDETDKWQAQWLAPQAKRITVVTPAWLETFP